MIKYELNTETFEYNPTKYLTAEEAYFGKDFDHYNKRVGIYDTLDEARKALAECIPETVVFSRKLRRATVYYIIESDFELNDDGEWGLIAGADIWDFTEEHDDVDEDEARRIEQLRDFEVIKAAQRSHCSESGYIVRYDGDLYFIYNDKGLRINKCVFWTHDIERGWSVEDYDPEFYSYYEIEGVLRPLELEV